MKKLIKIGLMLIAFLMINMEATEAQKYGYLNSQQLVDNLPEVKEANANINTLMEQYQKKGQQMVAAIQAKEQDAFQKKERGELSPAQEQTILAELQKEAEEIQTFEKNATENIEKKRAELLGPVQTKVQKAIQDVAKENGYTMILEYGVLLFAEDTADVSALVRSKLGI